MKILKIERKEETSVAQYVLITFKTWYGKEFQKLCFKEKIYSSVNYAESGDSIDVPLWAVVTSFLSTKQDVHEY